MQLGGQRRDCQWRTYSNYVARLTGHRQKHRPITHITQIFTQAQAQQDNSEVEVNCTLKWCSDLPG